jgi:hypothetical protein
MDAPRRLSRLLEGWTRRKVRAKPEAGRNAAGTSVQRDGRSENHWDMRLVERPEGRQVNFGMLTSTWPVLGGAVCGCRDAEIYAL